MISKIQLDSIIFDKVETSYSGIIKIKDDKLYFADKRFCWLYIFDKDGKLLSKNLGQGGGPKELNTGNIDVFEPLEDGGYVFIGAGNDCHLHDKNFERVAFYTIDNSLKGDRTSLKNKKDISADMKWVYTKCYPKLISRIYDNYLFYNIYCEHPNYNLLTADYYQNGRIIAKMDLTNGKIDILGRISPFYQKYQFLAQFSFINFDISKKGDFYINNEADPIIYVYTNDFMPVKAFGYNGQDMKTSYKEIKTLELLGNEYVQQREEYGYYTGIEYIDEQGLLFRSYTKGNKNSTDGLQIYKENCLIADLPAPKGFKVKGYIAPYVYSDVYLDEENELMKLYRFKIKQND